MDWKKLLGKLRIADVKAAGKQVGAINVDIENKTENKTYNFNFYDPQAAERFAVGLKVTPDFEKKVREEAERRLISLGIPPEAFSDRTRGELAGVTVAASTLTLIRETKPTKE